MVMGPVVVPPLELDPLQAMRPAASRTVITARYLVVNRIFTTPLLKSF